MFLIFLEWVKLTSIGIKLDRPHLQHWLLFLEHDKSQKTQMLLHLPVPLGYDYVYDLACNSYSSCDFE